MTLTKGKKTFLKALIVLDIILLAIILIFNPILFTLCLFLNMIIALIVLKKHYQINILNIERIANAIKASKIRKQLSKDEKYLEKIPIKTFDGSNSTTHPYIVYFEKPFNNHQYYMAHTPYNNQNIELENPSLCVSNDGIIFNKPKGIKDPLLPIIKHTKGQPALYYNDNFILYEQDQLQIWYRYTEEDKTKKPPKLKNQIFRIVSKDGANFSEPELMLDDDGIWYLSPSIIKIDGLYYMYYFDKDLKFYAKISQNLKKWSEPHQVAVEGFSGNFWHGEVKIVGKELYLLFISRNYELYFCHTDYKNPLLFKNCDKLHFNYSDKSLFYGFTHPYKSTFLVKDDYIDFYIPFSVNALDCHRINSIKRIKQTMTYTRVKRENYQKFIKEN